MIRQFTLVAHHNLDQGSSHLEIDPKLTLKTKEDHLSRILEHLSLS